jgi:hypothetical protein
MDDKIMEALKGAYIQDGIALVLGAGVSRDSNIPSWNDLLRVMVKNHVKGADDNTFNRLVKNNLSLTAIASLLEEHCGSRHDFVEAVRETLYDDFPFKNMKVDKYNRGEFLRFIQKGEVGDGLGKDGVKYRSNSTLRSIGALCTVRRMEKDRRGKLTPRNFTNPHIRSIVTLNMDALLQTYVSAFSTKRLVRTVERPSAKPYSERINLYHMHGYLHFDSSERSNKRDSTEAVVLTEQDYYNFFNQPNSMFNYTFLYLLREHPCLFIGLSMQDENIRRLLHYSKLERMQALANKLGISIEALGKRKALMEKEITRHFVVLQRNRDPQVNLANEETLGALGVKILWLNSYAGIRGLVKSLYTSVPEDSGNWLDVYGKE